MARLSDFVQTVLEKAGLYIPVFDGFLRLECRKLFAYRASQTKFSGNLKL